MNTEAERILDQLDALSKSQGDHDRRVTVNRQLLEDAASVMRGLMLGPPPGWDLSDHLAVPSRSRPLAAAFAVNASKGRGML